MSLAAALALHGGLLLALIHHAGDGLVGAGGTELDAINVDIVAASEVLESHTADAKAKPEAAAAARVAQTDAGLVAAMPEARADDRKKAEIAAAPAAADDVAPERAEEAERVAPAAVARGSAAAASSESSEASAAARGSSATALATQALAAAPPGLARDYAKIVLVALSRNKPKGSAGTYGTVKIGFTIAASGEVRSVRVARTSGKSILDEAALAAVKSAHFPAPPQEFGTGELAYEIPYIFR